MERCPRCGQCLRHGAYSGADAGPVAYRGQSRLMSALEAKANLLVAFGISWALQVWVVPILFGVQVNAAQGLGMVSMFTGVSFVRQYLIRRAYNRAEVLGHDVTKVLLLWRKIRSKVEP